MDKVALSEKSDKLTMNTREVMDLIKVLMLFHKLCEFPPEWLRKGWQRRALCKITLASRHAFSCAHASTTATLLQPFFALNCHPQLRIEGQILLLKWTDLHQIDDPDCVELYENMLPYTAYLTYLSTMTPAARDYVTSQAAKQSELGPSSSCSVICHFD